MPIRDDLLKPIAGDNPAGSDLRYEPIYDQIKEARREDDDAPQGDWQTERKVADWPAVIRDSGEALATQSKDLQLGAWLTEALLRREGFAGLHEGLDVLVGLVEQYWDQLYPEIEDGDAEMRAAPLQWLNGRIEFGIRLVPLDRSGFSLLRQMEARTVPTEAQASETTEKANARRDAIAEGKVTPEQVEEAFAATTKAWYRALLAQVQASIDSLKALNKASSEKFGDAAPTFRGALNGLDEIARSLNAQIKRKLETDPDPIDVSAPAGEDSAELGGDGEAGASLSAEPVSQRDAAARVASAARYLRREMPGNPAPFLMLRGLRWGELRAADPLDPRLLEAPATSVRAALKGLLLDARWPELIEAAENVMATPQGRGWLDLQRYVLTACEALGSEYDAASAAVRGALRSLLGDLPQLVDMTLMDDTPTANEETKSWLKSVVGDGASSARARNGDSDDGDGSALNGRYVDARLRDPIMVANSHARAGRPERAIALLMRESSREKTKRGRFVLQSQLARIMVEAGHERIAMPILEELIADIESYKLEEWEFGELVATPMTLLFRCMEKTEGDEATRQSLYLRICRLDPIQAIGLGPR
jgi:type VI secretion system protein ImpA